MVQVVEDPLNLGLTQRETPEERRLRKRVFMKDDIHWCAGAAVLNTLGAAGGACARVRQQWQAVRQPLFGGAGC